MSSRPSPFDPPSALRRRAQHGLVLNLNRPTAALTPRTGRPPRRTRGISWREFGLMVVTVVSLAQGAIFAGRANVRPEPSTPETGTLIVESTPSGIPVYVDGLEAGSTPSSLAVKPGAHLVELRGRGAPRVIPVKLAPGETRAHHVEMSPPAVDGRLYVASVPAGALVAIDGEPRGVTPLSIETLSAGDHRVSVSSGNRAIEEVVRIEPGTAASILVPLSTNRAAVPAAAAASSPSGWLRVQAPFEMRVFEAGRVVGTSEAARLPFTPGRHTIEVVNSVLGFRSSRDVDVRAGETAIVSIELPKSTMHLNAIPWAEVFVDGQTVGSTPLGNLAVTIGPHEILFRHPDLGERRQAVVVKAGEAASVSVDFRK
jgi:hypothetical protein